MPASPFRPAKHSHRLVISSVSHFVGEFGSDHFLLTHAWPSSGKRSLYAFNPASPTFRSYFVVAFSDQAAPQPEGSVKPTPNYSYVGDVFCVFLSIYFGKRFDNQGCMETNGHFCLPVVGQSAPSDFQQLPAFSHSPRKDLQIALNFERLQPIAGIFDSVFDEINSGKSVSEKIELAYAAGKFYLQALHLVESDPEIAYLNLVTAGEILSSGFDFTDAELFDDATRNILSKIKQDSGEKVYDSVKGKMYQVRRRFRLTLQRLICDEFYSGSESIYQFAALKREDIEARLNAAYDLRSRYLHTGARFGGWIQPDCRSFSDVSLGQPMVEPAAWKKILALAPTFIGLERLVRFCLLRFIHLHIAPIDSRLD